MSRTPVELSEGTGVRPAFEDEISAVAGVLLVAAIVFALMAAWDSPQAAGRFRLSKARELLREGRYSESVTVLEGLLPSYGEPETRQLLSMAYLARRDTNRSERQIRVALFSASPDLLPALYNQLGRALYLDGRLPDARDAWNEAIDRAEFYSTSPIVSASSRSARWHLAELVLAQGAINEALTYYRLLLTVQDKYSKAAALRIAQISAPNEPVIARNLIKAAEAQDTAATEPDARDETELDLGLPQLKEGIDSSRWNSTATMLRGALDDGNNRVLAEGEKEVFWGAAFLQQGEPKLALHYLDRAVEVSKNSADAHARLALALRSLGDNKGAVRNASIAVTLNEASDRKDALPHHTLAQLYTEAGDWAAAKKELDILSQIEPGSVTVALEQARYYSSRGQYDDAEQALIRAASTEQALNSPRNVTLDASLALALFYIDVRGEGCDKGLPAAQAALAQRPDSDAALDAVGWALHLCGRQNDAQGPLEDAVRAYPKRPRYAYHLARTNATLGRMSEARLGYERVIDLDPGGQWEKLARRDLVSLLPKR